MLKRTPVRDGWVVEYDKKTFTKYFLRHCDRIVLMHEPKKQPITCRSCGKQAPDDIKGLVKLARWGR